MNRKKKKINEKHSTLHLFIIINKLEINYYTKETLKQKSFFKNKYL